jgi:hypothetical protein
VNKKEREVYVPICERSFFGEDLKHVRSASRREKDLAGFFHNKIDAIKSRVRVRNDVYNGRNKLIVADGFFMKESDVMECLSGLKPKKCKGYDRIPLNVLYDAREILLAPLSFLFELIYKQKTIPDQWKV